MKTNKSIFLILFIFILNVSCKKDVDLKKEQTNKTIKSDMIGDILKKQLIQGANQYHDEAGVEIPKKRFEISELETNVAIINKTILSNGFKFITQDEFSNKIKKIFNRTIDFKSEKKYLYINFLNHCDREFIDFPSNGIDYDGFYIIKNERFITDFYYIPQIIDYQKEYPQISEVENNTPKSYKDQNGTTYSIEFWKDLKDLAQQRQKNIQLILHRNKYLFNDDKSSFVWLQFNDEYFLKSLVKTFGYFQDKQLLKWAIEKEKYDGKESEEFSKLLWHKTCDGKLVFHKETLELIAENKEKKQYYFDILNRDYISYLDNENVKMDLSFSEKAKIIANIINFIYLHSDNYNINKNMGHFAQWSDNGRVDEGDFSKEFKKHKYYDLKDFEKQWKEAKMEGDGIGLPGQE